MVIIFSPRFILRIFSNILHPRTGKGGCPYCKTSIMLSKVTGSPYYLMSKCLIFPPRHHTVCAKAGLKGTWWLQSTQTIRKYLFIQAILAWRFVSLFFCRVIRWLKNARKTLFLFSSRKEIRSPAFRSRFLPRWDMDVFPLNFPDSLGTGSHPASLTKDEDPSYEVGSPINPRTKAFTVGVVPHMESRYCLYSLFS